MTDPRKIQISLKDAEKIAIDALVFNGVKEEPANAITKAYLEAEKCGNPFHGLQLIPWVLKQLKKTKPKIPYFLSERGNSFLIDGAENPGPYVAMILVKKLLELTEHNSIAIGGIRNAGHLGMLSYYANFLTDKKMVALVFATTPSVTVPYKGKDPVLGTNPLCIAIPTQDRPIIFDASTTAITYHALLKAKETGEQLPPGVVLDKQGNHTQDPEEADPTRLLTFGDHKGFGLSLMIEVLSGALTGWKVGAEKAREIENDRFSTTMIAIRADSLVGQSFFLERVESLKKDIALSQSVGEARLPFSNSVLSKIEAENSGLISVSEATIETLKALSKMKL